MKRLFLVGALGLLVVLGIPAVASAAPSSGSSPVGGTPAGTNVGALISSNLISKTTGHHETETLVFSQTGGFAGGPLSGAGFEQTIVVQLDTENGEFTYTGSGLLSGPLVGAKTVTLAQGFTTFGDGEDVLGGPASSIFSNSVWEATATSVSKTANVSLEIEGDGINLLPTPEAALLPAGAVAGLEYGASWTIH